MVEITRDLNIQFPIRNNTIYVHSMPIRYEIFATYYKPISMTFTEIYKDGLDFAIGGAPRIAAFELKTISKKLGVWEGETGVAQGLVGEIHRLTNLVMLAPDPAIGWHTVQFSDALRNNLLTPREVAEVENILVFFTCVSVVQVQEAVPAHLRALSLWNVQTTLSNVTALCDLLRTSMKEEHSTKKKEVSSVPS